MYKLFKKAPKKNSPVISGFSTLVREGLDVQPLNCSFLPQLLQFRNSSSNTFTATMQSKTLQFMRKIYFVQTALNQYWCWIKAGFQMKLGQQKREDGINLHIFDCQWMHLTWMVAHQGKGNGQCFKMQDRNDFILNFFLQESTVCVLDRYYLIAP